MGCGGVTGIHNVVKHSHKKTESSIAIRFGDENMKRNYLLTVFVASSVLFLQFGCQEQTGPAGKSKPVLTVPEPAIGTVKAETPPEAIEGAPKITFDEVVHNFGEVGPGTKNTWEFKFTNTGDGLLKVGKIERSCSACTVARLSKKEYAPGESGVLKVTYHSDKRLGSTRYYVLVHSNDKDNPEVKLTIKAKVAIKVAYEPKRLNLSLKKENAGCPEITLTSLDNQPFSIEKFKSTADCITADYDSSVKATKFVLRPKVDMEKLRKDLNGRIKISLTHPETDTATIFFNALPEFKIDPPTIIILNAEPQKSIKREVWILSNYDEDFEIETTSSKKGIIRILSQKKIGNRYEFELEITPPAAGDKGRLFTDVFYVNLKGGEKLKIICRGFYSKKQENRPADKG